MQIISAQQVVKRLRLSLTNEGEEVSSHPGPITHKDLPYFHASNSDLSMLLHIMREGYRPALRTHSPRYHWRRNRCRPTCFMSSIGSSVYLYTYIVFIWHQSSIIAGFTYINAISLINHPEFLACGVFLKGSFCVRACSSNRESIHYLGFCSV